MEARRYTSTIEVKIFIQWNTQNIYIYKNSHVVIVSNSQNINIQMSVNIPTWCTILQ